MRKSAFVYIPDASSYTYGADHPFDPQRALRVYELCNRYGLLNTDAVEIIKPQTAENGVLQTAHSAEYLDALKRADDGTIISDADRWGLATDDCPIFKGLFEFAALSAGASCAALDAVLSGKAQCAFNPSGGFHHAYREKAEGFCYINDVVILLHKLLEAGKRPVFIDIDAHQPNGVMDAFEGSAEVLIVSFHETPRTLYPFKGYCEEMGEGAGKGYTVNIPLEPGADDEVFNYLLNELLPPVLERYKPDFLILEAGMDMLSTDPLTHLGLSSNALMKAVDYLYGLGLPAVMLGGGGYDVRNTVRGWTRAWAALTGQQPEDVFAGSVGGMMFGPEMEAGSLIDPPVATDGHRKATAEKNARYVRDYLHDNLLPLLVSRRSNE